MSFLVDKFKSNPPQYAAVIFAIISCSFFLPIVFQGKLLAPGDALIQYLPAFQIGTHFWTNQILCGFPWYADPQSQTFYPLKQILSLVPQGWNIYIMTAYALAGFFAALYAYSLTNCWTAALIAGCIFAFNGFLLSNLRHTTIVHSAIWLTLGLWSIRGFRIDLEQGKKRLAQWFCLTVGASALLCFAGHPQMFCYGLALLGAYVLAETWQAEKKNRMFFAGLNLLALGLAVGIATIIILPGAELGSFSWRWNMTYKLFCEYALLPVSLINQVFPFAFGSFKDSPYGCNYFGPYNLQSVLGYFGLFSFLLFPLGVFAQRKNKVALFWLAVLVVFFILLFGDVGPLSQLAYQLHCYNRFRIPTRHFLEISMAVSCLSAFGLAALKNSQIPEKLAFRAHALFVGFFIIAAVFAVLTAGASQERVRDTASGVFGLYPWTNPALGIPIILFVLGSILYFLCLKRPQLQWHAFVFFFVIDFATVALGSEYAVSSPLSTSVNPPEHAAWLNAEAAKTHQRILSLRGNSGSRDELPVNLSMLWGVENASGYENLLPLRISNLLNMKEGGFLVDSTWAKDGDYTLDILAVKYILLPKKDSRFPAPTGPRWRFVKEAGDALIYENLRAMPRAWLVHGTQTVLEKDAVNVVQTGRVKEKEIDLKEKVLIEEESDLPFKENAYDSAQITELRENQMTVKVKTENGAFLVTADSWYPGWKASIDGKETGIRNVDYVIRAVVVSPGEHMVKFEFSPSLLNNGIAISLSSLLAAAIIAFLLLRRSKPSPQS